MPAASQLPNPVTAATRPAGASFVPTSVIRNMAAGQRTAEDRHIKEGRFLWMICLLMCTYTLLFFSLTGHFWESIQIMPAITSSVFIQLSILLKFDRSLRCLCLL